MSNLSTNIEDYKVEKNHYEFTILESHLDTFGHVNNATYLELYEQARWEMITQRGWGLARIQKELMGPVITEINIKYLRELRLREKITITTHALEFKNSKILTIKQTMTNAQGKICSEFTMDAGLFDLKERKLLSGNKDWFKAIGLELK